MSFSNKVELIKLQITLGHLSTVVAVAIRTDSLVVILISSISFITKLDSDTSDFAGSIVDGTLLLTILSKDTGTVVDVALSLGCALNFNCKRARKDGSIHDRSAIGSLVLDDATGPVLIHALTVHEGT